MTARLTADEELEDSDMQPTISLSHCWRRYRLIMGANVREFVVVHDHKCYQIHY